MAEREVVWKALADFSSIVREAQKARKALAELDAAQGVKTATAATAAQKKQAASLGEVKTAAAQATVAEQDLGKAQAVTQRATQSKIGTVKQEIAASKERVRSLKDETVAQERAADRQKASVSALDALAARSRQVAKSHADYVKSLRVAGTTTDNLRAKQGQYTRELELSNQKLEEATKRLNRYKDAADKSLVRKAITIGSVPFSQQVKYEDALRKATAKQTLAQVAARKATEDRNIAEANANRFIATAERLEREAAAAKLVSAQASKTLTSVTAEHTIVLRNHEQAQRNIQNLLKSHAVETEKARAAEAAYAAASKGVTDAAKAQAAAQKTLDSLQKKKSATVDELSAAESRLEQAVRSHAAALQVQEQAHISLGSALDGHRNSSDLLRAAEEELAKVEAASILSAEKLKVARDDLKNATISHTALEGRHTAVLNASTKEVAKAEQASRRLGAARQAEAVATAGITSTMERYFTTVGERLTKAGTAISGFRFGLRESAIGLGIFGGLVPLVISALGQLATMLTSVAAGFMGMVGTLVSASGILGTLPGLLIAAGAGFGVMLAGLYRTMSVLKLYTQAQKTASGQANNTAKTARTNARQLRDAEDAIANAQRQAAKAQQALNQARIDAARNIEDLRKQVKQLALDEKSSSMSVEEARLNLQRAINDPGSTDLERRQAELAVQEAEARLSDVKDQQKQNQSDLAKAQQQGINGADNVVAAAEAQQQALDGVVKAQQNLEDVQSNVAESAGQNVAAANQYAAALAKMTPEARAVVLQLIALGGALRGIQATAERGIMPGVGVFISGIQRALPIVDSFVGSIARIGGDLFGRLGTGLSSRAGLGGLQQIFQNTIPVVQSFANIFYNLIKTFGNIAIAGGPLTTWLAKTVENWTAMWAAASSGADGQARLTKFFDGARQSLTLVGDAAKYFILNFLAIADGLKPLGDNIWKAIGDTTKRWNEFNRSVEGKNALKKWGDVAFPILTQLWGILADIGKGMMNIFSTDDITPFLKTVRNELGPAIGDMFRSFTGPQGQTIARGIAHIVEGLAKLFSSPEYVKTAAEIFREVGDALNWLGTEGKGMIPWLLGAVYALTLAKAAAVVVGPAIRGLGIAFNFFGKDLGNGLTAFNLFQQGLGRFGTKVSEVARAAAPGFAALLDGFMAWVRGIGKGGPRLLDSMSNSFKDYKTRTDAMVKDTEAGAKRVGSGWAGAAVGVTAIVAAGVMFGKMISDSVHPAIATLGDATAALEAFGKAGNVAGNDLDIFFKNTDFTGKDYDGVKNLDEAIRRLFNKTWDESVNDSISGLITNLTGIAGVTDSVKKSFATIDEGLANMDPAAAAKDWDLIRSKFEAAGVPIEKLVELFPQYAQKLQDAQRAQGNTVTSTQALTGNYFDLTDQAKKLADAQKKVADETNNAGNAAMDASDAAIAYDEALQRAKDSVTQNGKGLKTNTEAGRNNLRTLNDLAAALKRKLEADAKAGMSAADLRKELETGTAQIQAQAKAMTPAGQAVEDYASKYGLVPSFVDTLVDVNTADANKKMSDFAIQLGKLTAPQQAAIIAILQRDGYDAAQKALDAELAKNKTQYVDVVYNAAADYGPGSAGYEIGRMTLNRADGGIVTYHADGGVEQHVAQIAPAGAWRVWAEPETGGEAYIPLAPSKRERSLSIWRQVGHLLGAGAQKFARGGINKFANGGVVKKGVQYFATGGINSGGGSTTAGGSFANVEALFTSVSQNVTDTWTKMWDDVFSRLGKAFKEITSVGANLVSTLLGEFNGMFATLSTLFTAFRLTVASVFSSVFDAVQAPISSIISKVINPFIDGFNSLATNIPGVPTIGRIPDLPGRATGGIIRGPGTPTSDSILGVDRRGVPTARVSRDEYIVNAKSTRKYRSLIEAINADRLPRRAQGGLVTYKGGTFTMEFAKRLAFAEQLAHESFNISQGGFRPPTSYSGTSHQGDAVDIVSPVNNVTVIALRSTGIAAWDRTGKGNWVPHIHGVPLPGAGQAGGSAVWQAQDYLKGGDGLGGRDNGPRVPINPLMDLGVDTSTGGSWFDLALGTIFKPFEAMAGIGKDFLGSPIGMLASGLINTLRNGVTSNLNHWFGMELPITSGDTAYGTEGVPVSVGNSGKPGFGKPMAFANGGLVKAARSKSGYARGTRWASPGWRWAGENGPELVHFSGGEGVWPSQALATGGIVTGSTPGTPIYIQALQNMIPGMGSKSLREIQKLLNLFSPTLYSGPQDGIYTNLLGAAISVIQKKIGISTTNDGNLSAEEVKRLAIATNEPVTIYTGAVDPSDTIAQAPASATNPSGYVGYFRTAEGAIYAMLPDGSTKWMSPAEWQSLGSPWSQVFADSGPNGTANVDLANALGEQMRSNALLAEFNSYQDTFTKWGLDYLTTNFAQKGPADSLTVMRQLVQNRSAATTYDAMLKASGLELPNSSASDSATKRRLFIDAIAQGTDVGLQGASKAAGVSLDTGAALFDAITQDGGWGSISMSKLRRIVSDVNDFKQLFKFARFADGGFIGGSGSGDTQPIMATPGEFMLRKAAAETLGPDVLNYLNNIDRLPRFSIGGFVGGYNAPAVAGYAQAMSTINRSVDTNSGNKGNGPTFSFVVHNPVAEPTSVSTQKAILKLGRRGLLEM